MQFQHFSRSRKWFWWLVPKPFDLVSSVLYLGVTLTYFLYGGHCDCGCAIPGYLNDSLPALTKRFFINFSDCSLDLWKTLAFCTFIGALLFIDRWEYWRFGEQPPKRIALSLLILRIVLIETVSQLDHFNFSPFLYLIPPFLACLYFNNWSGYCLAALAWLTYFTKAWLRDPTWYLRNESINNLIVFTLGLIFAITMAQIVVSEQRSRRHTELLLNELGASHQQLKTYAAQVADLATTKERNRLARDIHDSLGHYLTVINVQLEKALAFRSPKPLEADQAVLDAKRLASEALQDVRRSVGLLRAQPVASSFNTSIQELIERVRSARLAIDLSIAGADSVLSSPGLIALYRITQEALTNVQKHAHAQQARVTIHFATAQAHLEVADDGDGFEVTSELLLSNAHYGLRGIQERVELVGGQLEIDSQLGTGTRLRVTIPTQSLVHSQAASTASEEIYVNLNH